MPGDGKARDSFYGTARNALLAVVALVAALLMGTHRFLEPREAVLVVAGAVALLGCLAILFHSAYGACAPVWIALSAAFVASRSVMVLAVGQVYSVRDALDHVYGLPLDIVELEGLPGDYTYSAYPVLHMLLALTHLVAGVSLWNGAALLAVALGLATMGLVARVAESAWKGSGPFAALGFIVAYSAISPGQLFQPMTASILFFTALVLLAVRDKTIAWGPGLFFVIVMALGLSHPYSAVIMGIMLFVALLANSFVGGRLRYLVPMAAAMALGVAYIAFVGQDLSRFLDLLQPNDVAAVPGSGATPASSGAGSFSEAYQFVSAWGFRLSMAIAFIGLVLALLPWPPRNAFLHALLGFAGVTYLLSRVVSYGFPARVLTIAAVVEAPFLALTFQRIPAVAASVFVAVLAAFAVTSPAATYQFFPFSEHDPTVHALEDPPETADVVPFYLSIRAGDVSRSNPVSSHQVFDRGQTLLVRSFATTDVEGSAPATHYLYREDSAEFGFAVGATQAGSPERRAAYSPFPTDGQIAFLDSVDRIGDFGAFHVHRA